MKKFPNSLVSTVLVCSFVSLVSVSCFKKGAGRGSRKVKPDASTIGDVFVPGPGNKPGSKKPTDTETPGLMDPEARQILADCFAVELNEVSEIVGWTDKDVSAAAATALCDDLKTVGYNAGVVNQTSAQVEID